MREGEKNAGLVDLDGGAEGVGRERAQPVAGARCGERLGDACRRLVAVRDRDHGGARAGDHERAGTGVERRRAEGVVVGDELGAVRLVQAVADGFSPDYVIAVDALATAKAERLGTCFQFTDSALRPGGGTGEGKVLDPKNLGSRLIAIGVPFIISAQDLGAKDNVGYFVPYDADKTTDICAKLIAGAVIDCF